MSDAIANVISVTKVHAALQKLLTTYTSEKAENQELKDGHGTEYWDSACLAIEEVAAALNISLILPDPTQEEQKRAINSKQQREN